MPKSKPIIAYQERIRRKRRDVSLREMYGCATPNPTLTILNRRYRAAQKLHDLAHDLVISILTQIGEVKARK